MSAEKVETFICDLLLGGVDTTGLNVSWMLYNLGDNPTVQVRSQNLTKL